MNYTALKNNTFTFKSISLTLFLVLLVNGNAKAVTADELSQKVVILEQQMQDINAQLLLLKQSIALLETQSSSNEQATPSTVTETIIAETLVEESVIEETIVITEPLVTEEVIVEETIIEAADEVIAQTETNICNAESSSEYTLTWDFDDSLDLTGYKVYYGTSSDLTKENAMGEFSQPGNANTTTFVPANLNLTTCETVYIAIAALGDKPESALSTIMEIVID